MILSDDILMAFADGALPPDEAAVVAAAVADDPQLQARVAAHRALRDAIADAYAGVLSETMPDRLTSAVQRHATHRLPAWAAAAAALAVAVLAAVGGWSLGQGGLTGGAKGREARGVLKAELDSGLASQPARADSVARVGLSFRTTDGYCRSFAVREAAKPWSGIACREGKAWVIRTATRTARGAPVTAYRQAATPLPAEILATVEETMVGEPLDAAQEAAARGRGWR